MTAQAFAQEHVQRHRDGLADRTKERDRQDAPTFYLPQPCLWYGLMHAEMSPFPVIVYGYAS